MQPHEAVAGMLGCGSGGELTLCLCWWQGEIGEPGQKGSKGDKGEQVSGGDSAGAASLECGSLLEIEIQFLSLSF